MFECFGLPFWYSKRRKRLKTKKKVLENECEIVGTWELYDFLDICRKFSTKLAFIVYESTTFMTFALHPRQQNIQHRFRSRAFKAKWEPNGKLYQINFRFRHRPWIARIFQRLKASLDGKKRSHKRHSNSEWKSMWGQNEILNFNLCGFNALRGDSFQSVFAVKRALFALFGVFVRTSHKILELLRHSMSHRHFEIESKQTENSKSQQFAPTNLQVFFVTLQLQRFFIDFLNSWKCFQGFDENLCGNLRSYSDVFRGAV